jgi:tetratricopeptide (TPR) repeat protein
MDLRRKLFCATRLGTAARIATLLLGGALASAHAAQSAATRPAPVKLQDRLADSLALAATSHTLDGSYAHAWQATDSLERLLPRHPVGALLNALTAFARYDDLSDLKDLSRAGTALRRADTLAQKLADPFWLGVMEFQRGYELTLRGHELKGAMATRAGAQRLGAILANSDAAGMVAIYAYYLSEATSWLPFVSDRRGQSLQALEQGTRESRYFSALYRNALVWILWDRSELARAEALAAEVVGAHPGNRIFQQVQGDVQRKAGKLEPARTSYRKSLERYATDAPGSIRHLSALGNMALIAHLQGNAAEAKTFAAQLQAKLPPQRDRMPPSLMKELEKTGLLK